MLKLQSVSYCVCYVKYFNLNKKKLFTNVFSHLLKSIITQRLWRKKCEHLEPRGHWHSWPEWLVWLPLQQNFSKLHWKWITVDTQVACFILKGLEWFFPEVSVYFYQDSDSASLQTPTKSRKSSEDVFLDSWDDVWSIYLRDDRHIKDVLFCFIFHVF